MYSVHGLEYSARTPTCLTLARNTYIGLNSNRVYFSLYSVFLFVYKLILYSHHRYKLI